MNKHLTGVTIKDADQGLVEAVFSTFDVIDKDGDITLKEAFTDGAPVVISSYGHKSWDGALPVGKGTIEVRDTVAVLKGQFFMDTTHGRDTFVTLAELAKEGLGEWSYGLMNVVSERKTVDGKNVRVLKSIDVPEVSPVLVGAGVNTRTLATKGTKQLQSSLARLLTQAARARWNTGYPDWQYAWLDDYDPDDGYAVFEIENTDGCRLVQVTFTRTDTAVTLGDDETEVHRTATYLPKGYTFSDHAHAVLADVHGITTRAAEVMALRAEKGKTLSDESAGLLDDIIGALDGLKQALQPTNTEPADNDDAVREYLRFVAANLTAQGGTH